MAHFSFNDDHAPEKKEQGAAVRIRGLHVDVDGRVLFDHAAADFRPGEISLIVGSSGVGKSVLLGILAGLIHNARSGFNISGSVLIGEDDIVLRTSGDSVGVVFQEFALFDELSPQDNVRFARDHRPPRSRSTGGRSTGGRSTNKAAADDVLAILAELNVPRHTPIAHLSGGQKQRLAIARTLSYRPDVLLYDEPTSGLDPATGRNVAALIKRTHDSHPAISIIVTHDYASLAPIADRIYLVDPETKSLRESPPSQWPALHKQLQPPDLPEPPDTGGMEFWPRRAVNKLQEALDKLLIGTSRAVEETAALPLRLLPIWKRWKWGLRFLLHYLNLVAGPSAWLYIAIAGAILGFVSTYFTFHFLPYANYTEPLLLEELLQSIGFALYRVLAPILITILIAARCGAAVASDVGGKVYSRQTDALRTFAAPPHRYLLTPILYAFLLGAPLLLAVGYLAAEATSLVVFTATHATHGPAFWQHHFHRMLRQSDGWFFSGTGWLLAKTLVCATGIALVAYHRGMAEKKSSRDVSRGITTTILWATLLVLVVHFVFAFWEFDIAKSS